MAFAWAEITVPTSSGSDVNDYIWDSGHSLLCAVGGNGLVYTTPDLVTVTKRTAAAANRWNAVAFSPSLGSAGRLVAVGSSAGSVMSSDDGGITWTSRTLAVGLTGTALRGVAWAPALSLFAAVGDNGAAVTQVMTSPDGITWTVQNAALVAQWKGVTWSSSLGLFVAAAGNTTPPASGFIMTSTDGTTWTQQATPANVYPAGLVTSGSNFVTWDATSGLFACASRHVGNSTRFVTTSPDGTTWTEQTIPNNSDENGGLIGFPGAGLVLFRENTGTDNVNTSPDGVTWATVSTGFNRFFYPAGKIESLNKICAWAGANTVMLVGTFASVTSLSPSVGPSSGDTVVTILGVGLSAVTSVTFGGTAAAGVVATSTTVTCITPEHIVGVVDVVVVSVGTMSGAFTFVEVTRVSPRAGTVAGGTAVTVTGFGFAGATEVLFGGIAATDVVVVSNTSITAVTPAHSSGAVDVTVVGVDTGTGLYTYTLPVPQNLGKGPLLPPIPGRRQG